VNFIPVDILSLGKIMVQPVGFIWDSGSVGGCGIKRICGVAALGPVCIGKHPQGQSWVGVDVVMVFICEGMAKAKAKG
jgi:hypothetical protein